jgi:hypothetical protein
VVRSVVLFLRRRGRLTLAALVVGVLVASGGAAVWHASSTPASRGSSAAGEAARGLDRGAKPARVVPTRTVHVSRVRHVSVRTNTKVVARPKGESSDQEREPKTPFARVTRAPLHPVVAPYVAPVRLARTVHASKGRTSAGGAPAAAPSDFLVNAATDLGCAGQDATRGCTGPDPKYWDYSLVNEPSVSSNGSSILETWNWHTAYSTNSGASFNYIDPYTAFPDAFGHFCCDQLAYYDPSRDLFIWVLQYSPDGAGHNVIRLAVANGAAGLAANSWYYWDFSAGTSYWFDQPKIATSANDAYLEISKYGSSSNAFGGSVMIRFPLDQLKNHTPALTTDVYSDPATFSPAPVQRAGNTMYFATRNPFASDSTHLRVYSWPESASTATYNDVTISADPPFPNTTGYSCPKTGQPADSSSDWCPRKSSTGGFAHDIRINSGFLSNGTIVFSWDAPQGTAVGGVSPGTFPYPYTHVVRINEATKALIDQPIAWSPNYAVQWSSLASNANGDIAGIVQYGGGAEHEDCGALIHDGFVSGGFWEFHNLVSSDSDTSDTKSGDYTATRGMGNSWIGSCYVLKGGSGTGYVHPQYVNFGRRGTPPAQVTLTVTKSGDGSGTVTSSPAGISCGATCSANFNTGTAVTLTVSNPGSTFAGWSGGGCSGTGACTVTMSAAQTVNAQFNKVGAPPTILSATVGPGKTIKLTKGGRKVASVLHGKFKIVVQDKTTKDNFHLTCSGVNKKTKVKSKSTSSWSVTLKKGKCSYKSDAHKKLKGSFKVK